MTIILKDIISIDGIMQINSFLFKVEFFINHSCGYHKKTSKEILTRFKNLFRFVLNDASVTNAFWSGITQAFFLVLLVVGI